MLQVFSYCAANELRIQAPLINQPLIENAVQQQKKLLKKYGVNESKLLLNKCHQLINSLGLNLFKQCIIIKAPFANAYSLAHGTVILTEGLLTHINNDDQLAHILAHEHAHLLFNHHQQTQHLINNPPKFFTKSRIKKFYREIEQQADQAADKLLKQKTRDPLQINHYLLRIEKSSPEKSNDHQKIKDRIQRQQLPDEVFEKFWQL